MMILESPSICQAAQEDDGRHRDRVFGVWPYRIGGQDWYNVFTHGGDAGGHHHIQRRGSRPDVHSNERVRIPGGTSTATTPICPSRSIGTYVTHGSASGSTPFNYTTERAPPTSSYSGC